MFCVGGDNPGRASGRLAWRALCVFIGAGLFFAPVPRLQAQTKPEFEAGRVTARPEQGYARLIFSFAKRPSHSISGSAMNSGILVLNFDHPVDVGVSGLAEKLPTYITSVRRDSDGKSIRFALMRKVQVNTSEVGNELYLDLMPEPWLGAPPLLPPDVVAELMRQAQEEERVRKEEAERALRAINLGPVEVKASEAPTFTRIEFLWRDKVPTALQRSGDQLKIVFERLGTIDTTSLRAHLPRFVDDISVAEVDLRMVVTLKVDPMRDVRMFEEGNAVSVDIQGPQRGALEFRADGQISKSSVPGPAASGPTTKLVGLDQNKSTETEEQAKAPAAQESFVLSAPASLPVAEQKNSPSPSLAPVKTIISENDASQPVMPETATVDGLGARIVLGFKTETAAAIFQRGHVLWLVFATDEKIDTKPIAALLGRKLRRSETEYQDGLAIVRLDLDPSLLISAAALDTNWQLTLGDAIIDKSEPAELKAYTAPDGRNIVNGYMNRAVSIKKLRDPVAGDEVTVVLAIGPAIGMIKPQQFIDFTSLATMHGAAMLTHADDLTFRLDDIGFVIERSGSMAVSIATAPRSTQLSPQQLQIALGYVDFESWKLGAPDQFNQIKTGLIERAAMGEGPMRNAARLDLARFYLAYELGPEALSLLNLVAQDDPATERELSFRIIRGVANVFSSRYQAAERDLSDPLLDDNADIAIWRGLAAAQKSDWKLVRRNLEKAQTVMVNYPRPLQAKVLLQLARATIELQDLVNTDAVLDEANNTLSDDKGIAELTLLRGRFNEAVGRYDVAADFYKQIDVTLYPQIGAEAILRLVTLEEKLGKLPEKDAIEKLEALSFAWRGDDLELEMYQRLGGYYAKSDQFRPAFTAMRSATLANAEAEISRKLYDDMRVVFTSFFLDGKADSMPALDVLSLFYDFRELTPAGRLGDEIIRGLAERLVEVDLLDQAISLLTHQVNNRLTGIARTEAGAELALVHLMNREPQKSLSVLHRTRQTSMPADLEKKRTLIEARALAGTGRPELATELLSGEGEENMRLRADILWEGKSWKLCGETLEKLLGTRWRKENPLSEQDRADIMRGAVTFALAEDKDGVRRFRSKFAHAMSETAESHLFDVATGPIEGQGSEFRALARSLASIDNLQNFWKAYRIHYSPRGRTPEAGAMPAVPKKDPA